MNPAPWHLGDAFALEEFWRQAGGGPAAGIQTVELAGFGLIYDGEEIAANTIHHRREQAQRRVGGHRRVHGVAALAQDAGADLGCQRVLGGDDAVARDDHRARLRATLLYWGA